MTETGTGTQAEAPVEASAEAQTGTPAGAPVGATVETPVGATVEARAEAPEGAGGGAAGAGPAGTRRDRRALRAALRWTAAAVVLAAVGAGTAYGIGALERTDVPGLATASDGRWAYPALTLPPLPSGSPGPFADSNPAEAHHADLRALVLPAPEGAKEDPALRGSDGWLPTGTFLAEYSDASERDVLRLALADRGLRHIAARGWTMPDGTRTRIYLLRFGSGVVVHDLFTEKVAPASAPGFRLRGTDVSLFDDGFPPQTDTDRVQRSAYDETEPYGAEQVRHAYLSAGDVLALVVQSREGTAAAVPFQQTVVLQSQLLG
ncbi:hypothetical protein [Streptomyces sp. NPDC101249]|uniref:hypothetical protein n=1 Tax=Streptomyces sp. NPDC101249 TaxID=3366140 RepID=UPI003819AA0C